MSRATKTRAFGLLCASVLAVALLGATATAKPAPKVVTVADFYYSPAKVTIRKGGKVKWVWSSLNAYPHDVHLKQGPRGLKKKGSYSTKTTAVTNARFIKQFPTPGSYKYVCTLHSQMKMTVTVKK